MNLSYFFHEFIRNIRENRFITFIVTAIITSTLLIFSLFFLIYYNFQHKIYSLKGEIKFIAYLKEDISEQEVNSIKDSLDKDKIISKIEFVSPKDASEKLKEYLTNEKEIIQNIGEDILPPSFEININQDHLISDEVIPLVERIRKIKGIEGVQYNSKWIDKLNLLGGLLKIIIMSIGTILGAAIIFIISSTITLLLYNRREEIKIMKLMGATDRFIKFPYLLEGSFLGLTGASLSLIFLNILFYLFIKKIYSGYISLENGIDISFLPLTLSMYLLIFGMLLGYCGSLIALKRVL
ncbi:MAG: cell division protein FtsX [Nitrospirota bacterium]